jgi:cell division protein FtsI (penicillin-binding protein 3)
MGQENKLIDRVKHAYFLVIVFALVVIGKILYTQVWEGEYWRQRVFTELVKDKEVPPSRGNIYAEDGRVLSLSLPSFTLYFDPLASQEALFRKKVDSLALLLSRLFRDASPLEYRQKMWNARYGVKPNRYLRLGSRDMTYVELQQVMRYPLLRTPKEQEKETASGLIYTRQESRQFPHTPLARRTIGFLSMEQDGIYRGKVGLEEAYEKELRGIPGISRNEMLSGRWVPRVIKKPVDGYDVITTIDINYQYIVHEALERQLKHYNARSGVAVLMEVKTGDVKAIANLGRRQGEYVEVLNSAISDVFEPGSVFKAAIMIALLEDGHVHPDDTVDLGNGVYHYQDGKTLRDPSLVGKITVQRMFELSSNGISTLLYKHYNKQREKFVDRLYAMQLNKKLGVEITGEGAPLIRYPTDKEWSGNTLPWMSIGYEVLLTPMQVLAFYNAIANGGKRVKPRFVKEIRDGDKVVRRVPVEVSGQSICSRKTLESLCHMLEGVVERGTASRVRGSSYGIAGKTGTAKIADGRQGYEANKKYLASFVGYFPAKEPLYSCIVMIEDPVQSRGYYGDEVSGTVFREISDKVYALFSSRHGKPTEEKSDRLPVSKNGYAPDLLTLYDALDIHVKEEGKAEWVLSSRAEEEIVLRPRNVDFSVVPNVRGMGIRDALYVLENSGLNVGVSGAGMVTRQTIEPGRRVSRGSYIHIELR